MISAKILADSKNEFGNRLTTMIVTFPRIILAEFNTHRMFSRNSASSRAIPFEKMVQIVKENPFIPIAWQIDHKGMQGIEYLNSPIDIAYAHDEWLDASKEAIKKAKILNNDCKITKQLCNRLLEPFMWTTVIVSATEWENFFCLRCPQYYLPGRSTKMYYRSRKDVMNWFTKHCTDKSVQPPTTFTDLEGNNHDLTSEDFWRKYNHGPAEIHMMALAEAMWDTYNESSPKELKAGEWHIPFKREDYIETYGELLRNEFDKNSQKIEFPSGNIIDKGKSFEECLNKLKVKIATARCARVSYTIVGEEDKADNYEADIKLHDRLATSSHWSPFEHCAKAMSEEECFDKSDITGAPRDNWSGNFRGFIQYRKTFNNENLT